MKKALAFALTLAFCFSALIPAASAYTLTGAGIGTVDFNYQYTDAHELVLTAYYGSSPRVSIPASMFNDPVVAIWEKAFRRRPVHAVSIPEGVTEIGASAFSGCTDLGQPINESAEILCVGDSITWGSGSNGIPGGRWMELTYPSQLQTILSNSSTVKNYGVSGLSVLPDPASNRVATNGAMSHSLIKQSLQEQDVDLVLILFGTNDAKLTGYNASTGRIEPGVWDDSDTGGLTRFKAAYRTLVEAYQSMASHPQVICVIPPPVLEEGTDDRSAYRITEWVLRDHISPAIREVAQALGCSVIDLRKTFPDPTTEAGLNDYLAMTVDCVHPNDFGYSVIASTINGALQNLYFPAHTIKVSPAEAINFPKSLRVIGESAFWNCAHLSELTIPAGVKTIGDHAFAECYGLNTVTVLGSPAFGSRVFSLASSSSAMENRYLTIRAKRSSSAHLYANRNKIAFEPILTGTPDDRFDYLVENGEATVLSYLGDESEVTLPATLDGFPVTKIASLAFSDRNGLISVSLPNSVTAIEPNAFSNCPDLLRVDLQNANSIRPSFDPKPSNPYFEIKDYSEQKLLIDAAASDIPAINPKTGAECAVENLRAGIEGGLWYMGDVSQAPAGGSDAEPGERYLTLHLAQTANLDHAKIQWYQGSAGREDGYQPVATQNRKYQFRILASTDGISYTQIYPENGNDRAVSGTGVDFETYPAVYQNANYVRISGFGSTGDKNTANNKFMAIRNVELYSRGAPIYPENQLSEWAFASCPSLISVSLPSGIEYCAPGAFYGCPALERIKLYSSPQFAARSFTGSSNPVLYGFSGSRVQIYAETENVSFIPLDEPIPLAGDADGNGTVALADLLMIAKHLAGWELGDAFFAENADPDGDGQLTVSDLTLLAKFLAGWEVSLCA